MRKILGAVLVGLGVFALAAAVVATFWAPGVVKKTPLDVNSVTTLSGEGARLNAAGDALDPAQPVSAVSVTRSDTDVSTDETIVFVSNTCLNVDEGQEPGCYDPQTEDFVLSNSPLDVIAVDRKSAMAVDSDVEQVTSHEGLINKWPFDAEQKTYPYWDSVTQSAVDASYDRTEVLDGLETYVYQVQISDAPTMVSGLSTENDGTYDDLKEIYVDPRTGSIVNQTEAAAALLRQRHAGPRPEPGLHRRPGGGQRHRREGQHRLARPAAPHRPAGRLHPGSAARPRRSRAAAPR